MKKRITLVTVLIAALVVLLLTCRHFADRGMRKGCNLAMLNMAGIDYLMVSNSLYEARLSTLTNTNEMDVTEREYFIKKMRYEFWKEDVRRRGHRGTIPQFELP